MPIVTVALGGILILLGVGGYVASGMVSATALIPAGFGILFEVCGVLARKESLLKHAMHGAAVLALVGFFGTISGIIEVLSMVAGAEVTRPQASIAKAIMAVLMVAFLVLCIRSFRAARLAREAAAGS